MTDLIPQNYGDIRPVGVKFYNLSEAEWVDLMKKLLATHEQVQFYLGDCINFANKKWGEKYKRVMELGGHKYQYLRDCAWVCRVVKLSSRNDNLLWSHHKELAKYGDNLTAIEQIEWLKKAEENGWSAVDLREQLYLAHTNVAIESESDDAEPEFPWPVIYTEFLRATKKKPVSTWPKEQLNAVREDVNVMVSVLGGNVRWAA